MEGQVEKIKPMLARDGIITDQPDMLWEPKYDGVRILSYVSGGDYYLQARSGSNKTDNFPELSLETRLPAILDGEIISADRLSFQDSIQKRVNRQDGILQAAQEYPIKLMVFDILEVDGENVEQEALSTRKTLLSQVLIVTNNVELVPFTDDGESLFKEMESKGLEGVIGKSKSEVYLRNKRRWTKVKCWLCGTFMAVGYTTGTGWRVGTFGALVLSDMEGNYVGQVGTGFTSNDLSDLCKMFYQASCPFLKEPQPAIWIKPFAINVRYLEYTNNGILRFPSFKGII